MLAVDRAKPLEWVAAELVKQRRHQVPSGDQRLLVGERHAPPARSAASTAGNAAMPVVATTTSSTASGVASSSSPPSAQRSCAIPDGRSPGAHPRRGGQAASCSARGRRRAGGQRHHLEALGVAATTSSVWRPIDPVEPRTATPVTHAAGDQQRVTGEHRGGEQERVDSVEDAAVPGHEEAGLLATGGPLQHRLGQVAGLRGDARPPVR